MNIQEIKNILVQERLGDFFRAHDIQHKTDYLISFGMILQKSCPELQETYSKHLDCYAEQIGEEKEEIYLFGVCDGLRLANMIAQAIK